MNRHQIEVFIGREQRQPVAEAQLRDQRVDSADLSPCTPAAVSQVCGVDMVLPVGNEQRQGRKPLDDALSRARAGESVEQFLQNEARSHHDLAALQSTAQRLDFRPGRRRITAERERPDACIDEQAHPRERSAL